MSRTTAVLTCLAVPITALLWYPTLVAPAGLVGAILLVPAIALTGPRPTRDEPECTATVARLHSRWLPGLGVGVSLTQWPPRLFAFLTLWRVRR
jgi:alpha-beta hydrolase superfamily lysophospholipase